MNMMKTGIRFAAAMALITIVLAGGCQKEEKSDSKMYRLIAAENEQLKTENEKLKSQIEQLKQQLAKSEEERKAWEYKAEHEIKDNVEGIMKMQLEENIKLTQEIEQLQAEIAKLKGKTSTGPEVVPEQPKESEEPNTVPNEVNTPAIPQ